MSSGRPPPSASVAPPKHWGGRDIVAEVVRSKAFRWGGPAVLVVAGALGITALNAKKLGISDPWGESWGTFDSPKPEVVPQETNEDSTQQHQQALAAEAEACRTRILEAKASPALPGAPRLEERRALLLARAKAEPVLFLDVPEYTGEVSRGTAARRKALLTTEYPRDVFRETLGTFRDFPERLRELILRDGYI